MLTGKINSRLEAVVKLWVRGSEDRVLETEAIVDTGFSGFLSLTQEMVADLGLPSEGEMRGILADGRETFFPVYKAIILWHGQPRLTYVSAVESEPLLGMSMLYGSEFAMQVIEGGEVAIRALGVS